MRQALAPAAQAKLRCRRAPTCSLSVIYTCQQSVKHIRISSILSSCNKIERRLTPFQLWLAPLVARARE